jgi:hypothetical protein
MIAEQRTDNSISRVLRHSSVGALLLTILLPAYTFAQSPLEDYERSLSQWRFGTLVLSTGDTLFLEFTFANRSSEGLLQVKDGGQVITLVVEDIASFYFYDIESDRGRNFRTLEASFNGKDIRKRFLEYHFGDKNIAVVSEHQVGVNYLDRPYKVMPKPIAIYGETTYLLDVQRQTLIPFNRRNAFRLMKDQELLVETFIKANGIRLKSPDDYQSVFQYYSTLLE